MALETGVVPAIAALVSAFPMPALAVSTLTVSGPPVSAAAAVPVATLMFPIVTSAATAAAVAGIAAAVSALRPSTVAAGGPGPARRLVAVLIRKVSHDF